MAWTLAREYSDESVCSAGAVSPLAVTRDQILDDVRSSSSTLRA
jgi:hypothetical protein